VKNQWLKRVFNTLSPFQCMFDILLTLPIEDKFHAFCTLGLKSSTYI
jgi:hypothetical protein